MALIDYNTSTVGGGGSENETKGSTHVDQFTDQSTDGGFNSTGASELTNNTQVCANEYCVSDEEYVNMIHEYITPTTFEWVVVVLYIVVFLAGLVGNFLVCFVVWKNRHMRTVTNMFIVNLSVADFLVILICLPPTVLGDVTETWYMGGVMCKIVQYVQVGSLYVGDVVVASPGIRWRRRADGR